jgi:hypothetical protein
MPETGLLTEVVAIEAVKPHPRNYRAHPQDQLLHIAHSIKEHGLYRNVVVAKDGTILAGHGVVEAAKMLGMTELTVMRLPIGPEHPKALKILTGDNELSMRAEIDDRLLSELLRQVQEEDVDGLLGTGYDEQMLANLIFVTRPSDEVERFDDAAVWAGLPDYEESTKPPQMLVYFQTWEDRDKFLEVIDVKNPHSRGRTISTWWPERPQEDLSSARWEE